VLGGANLQELLDVFLGRAGEIVGGTAMVRDIQTDFLFERVDAEHTSNPEEVEEGGHEDYHPSEDPEDAANLAQQQVGIRSGTPREEPALAATGVAESGSVHEFATGEESGSDDAPHAVTKVHGDGVDGVIDAKLDQELGHAQVHPSTNGADDDGGPRVDGGSTRRNGDETSEASVHSHGEIVGDFSGLPGVNDRVGEHGDDATRGGGEGRCGRGEGSGSGRRGVVDGKSRTGVESVPAEPEGEGSQDLERYTVGGEGDGFFEGVAVLVVEASLTGSEDNGSNKSGRAARHVHDARSGKVDDSDATEGVGVESGKEATGIPDRVDDDGVNESGQEDGVAKVGSHLTAFGDGTGHDGGGSGRESELEEPVVKVGVIHSPKGEERVTDEVRDVAGRVSTVRKTCIDLTNEIGKTDQLDFAQDGIPWHCAKSSLFRKIAVSVFIRTVTDSVETESATAGVEQVLEHDILDVLLTDGTGTEHGEPGLHQEDQGSLLVFESLKAALWYSGILLE